MYFNLQNMLMLLTYLDSCKNVDTEQMNVYSLSIKYLVSFIGVPSFTSKLVLLSLSMLVWNHYSYMFFVCGGCKQ